MYGCNIDDGSGLVFAGSSQRFLLRTVARHDLSFEALLEDSWS